MRQRNVGGRFNQRHDVDNVFEGMAEDLQAYEGQTILWHRFDRASSRVDPIYDVGDDTTYDVPTVEGEATTTGGRQWRKPFAVPVISVIRTEGEEQDRERGLYTTDSVHVVISYDQAAKVGLRDIDHRADSMLGDRFVWNAIVYSPTRVQARGLIRHQYTVIGIDARQVNPEELVNDPDFALYALR